MDMTLAYRGQSRVASEPARTALTLAPNLRRDRVSYDGQLRDPLRFREAISALHEVVVGDLRFQPADHTAYRAYRADQDRRERAIRSGVSGKVRQAIAASMPELPEPYDPSLETRYKSARARYWKARLTYSSYLQKNDPALWRRLVPCDPVITVAPDCLFFECFSADESSYGCLKASRDAFDSERDVALGTTNVDYSQSLFEHFQTLRSHRSTQFRVDPTGFEVRTEAAGDYREEKIELPPSWLRGFLQLQAAMSLPMRRVPIAREGLYGILAYLRRHRAARSPRAIRFELEPGRPPVAVLEPWERRVDLHGRPHDGQTSEVIRVWGRDRLQVLNRLLPIMDGAEVYLLGTGLPSVWVVRAGPLTMTLGLSGWTVNSWTGSTALDQLAPPGEPDKTLLQAIATAFRESPARTFDDLAATTRAGRDVLARALNHLAQLGLLVHDLPAGLYRWRQIMPVTLSAELIGPEPPETRAARELVANNAVKLVRDDRRPDGLRVIEGTAGTRPTSLLLDADGRMLRARCTCSHHFTGGLRKGPCRHLQALRIAADQAGPSGKPTLGSWFARLLGGSGSSGAMH